jgi:predicted NAD-dependent protein-ADP-ribosyltransferase YbiA (DUF1768 family)
MSGEANRLGRLQERDESSLDRIWGIGTDRVGGITTGCDTGKLSRELRVTSSPPPDT